MAEKTYRTSWIMRINNFAIGSHGNHVPSHMVLVSSVAPLASEWKSRANPRALEEGGYKMSYYQEGTVAQNLILLFRTNRDCYLTLILRHSRRCDLIVEIPRVEQIIKTWAKQVKSIINISRMTAMGDLCNTKFQENKRMSQNQNMRCMFASMSNIFKIIRQFLFRLQSHSYSSFPGSFFYCELYKQTIQNYTFTLIYLSLVIVFYS